MRRFLFSAVALATLVVLGNPTPANATLVLRLTQGVNQVTVVDGDGDGVVGFNGTLGVFNVNVSTGISKPVFPADQFTAKMDLNSVNASNAPGTLTIELTDTNFPAFGAGDLVGHIGGTTNGTLEAWGYKNPSNQPFDTTNPAAMIHLGPFTPTAFSDTQSAPHGALGTYSMTQVVTITHGEGVNSTSFNYELINNAPAPAGLLLLASGAPAFALAWLRRRKAQS